MLLDREFLGWDRPVLEATVAYLFKRFCVNGNWDMSTMLIVTPGAQAGRRLLELLALQVAHLTSNSDTPIILVPPETTTVGPLAEALYTPEFRIATETQQLMARLCSLRAHREKLAKIVPFVPDDNDLASWIRIAKDFEMLHRDLAGENLACGDVSAASLGHFDTEDTLRWNALEELNAAACHLLEKEGLQSQHVQRLMPNKQWMSREPDILLLACVEIPTVVQGLLKECGARVIPLVWAPEVEAGGFNAVGCLIPEHWAARQVPLGDRITMVDRPIDQANAIAEQIVAIPPLARGSVSVALGDETLGLTVVRLLRTRGIRARRSAGRLVSSTGPALLLSAVADVLRHTNTKTVGSLLRQPDIHKFFDSTELSDPSTWITHLSEFSSNYLPVTLDQDWDEIVEEAQNRSHDDALTISERRSAVDKRAAAAQLGYALADSASLLDGLRGDEHPINVWADEIANILIHVYRKSTSNAECVQGGTTVEALALVSNSLNSMREIADFESLQLPMSGLNALTYLSASLEGVAIPDESSDTEIELVGWLNAPMEDTSALIVSGFNEGVLPESISVDAFLPNRMRTKLGLLDSAGRYARDAYWLTASSHSRGGRLSIICGRQTSAGDPLSPSRLLFACDDERVIARSLAFYGNHGAEPQSATIETAHVTEYSLARIPRPLLLKKPIEQVRVTSFRDYITCPYRFYLKHIVGIGESGESPDEMSSSLFGTFVHQLMAQFATSNVKDTTDSDTIKQYLDDQITQAAHSHFGGSHLPAVSIQLNQIRRRLHRFAEEQAKSANEGWRILHCEKDLKSRFSAEDTIAIFGRIDRIDWNQDEGTYRILDYKTGDKAKKPESAHISKVDGVLRWTDLQLPLYRHLAVSLGIDPATVQVGYISICSELKDIGWDMALWTPSDFQSAELEAQRILHCIQDQVFWPPTMHIPKFPDGLETICMDQVPDRAQIIAKSNSTMADWTDTKKDRVPCP